LTSWGAAPFTTADIPEWEALVSISANGTILHRREFLGYHGDRFVDRSLVVRGSSGRICGIFPAAQSPDEATTIVSHPGTTFGGMLTDLDITGESYECMMAEALATWARMGYRQLYYKPVPYIYHRSPRQEDGYVLWRLGSQLSRRTLSACIDLAYQLPISGRRKRSLSKARASGCSVRAGYELLADFWPVAESALQQRHRVRPVHSLAEIRNLALRFPMNITCLAAFIENVLVGGVVLFTSPMVSHVQYSLSSPRGLEVGAMDLLIDHAITESRDRKIRFFDLGISTDHSGQQLNEGLHRFKMEFGAGTVVYDEYAIALANV
jgi:hypothetical protein